MYKKLILKNDFHNTSATFRVEHLGKIEIDDVIKLSEGQVRKAKRLLCPGDTCMCSGDLGTRADFHELDGIEVDFQENVKYNNLGELLGASLYVEKIW